MSKLDYVDQRDEHADTHDNWIAMQQEKRRRPRGGCAYCDEHGDHPMMPSHDPSPRCESGKRPHCTCDVCF